MRIKGCINEKQGFQPIPSTGGKYEINKVGEVRNAKTQRLLTPYKRAKKKTAYYGLRLNGKLKTHTRRQMLFEVFGTLPPTPKGGKPVGITAVKGNVRKVFPSLRAAARFLAVELSYSPSYILKMLGKKRPEKLGDWEIMYREPEERILRPPSKILSDKYLKTENKYWENFYSDNKTAENVVK